MIVKMTPAIMAREAGLALVGSLLLVSMLAVMSTTFLLLMAADVRIAQSHFRNTQAYYLAESAAEIASLLISAYPDTAFPADSTIVIVTDTLDIGFFGVYSYSPELTGTGRRQLRIRAASGKAWYDMYAEIIVPTQDPRTYYPVVATIGLELGSGCRVEGGQGVWLMGSNPKVDALFEFFAPSASEKLLLVGGTADWWSGGVAPEQSDSLQVQANAPTMSDIFPEFLFGQAPDYPYYITGDPVEYHSLVLPDKNNIGGSLPAVDPVDNPMSIYIWDHSEGDSGTFNGVFNLNGTLYCPGTDTLIFRNGDVTINPDSTGTSPNEFYPSIVSNGSVKFVGNGDRVFNGLVYTKEYFIVNDAMDASGSVLIDGALIAGTAQLLRNTTITYNSILYTMPAAAFMSTVTHRYPTIHFHRRRFLDLP